jgi:tetratricopeptide (TPR) repeat protein
MDKSILEYINQRKVTFFIGAGISMIPPSCLPSWWQVNHIILDSLADESYSLVPEIKDLVNLIKKREEDGKLPPEFVSEIITDRIGESYFDVLQGLEGETPNQAHLWLATLAQAGFLKAIITTNFDTLVERAFEIVGVPITVLVDPEDYDKIDIDREVLNNNGSPCVLLKLHGTATRPDTCVDTLAQRKQGLHPNIIKALNYLGAQTFWILLGYSGADLEANPNYLGIRARKNNSPGFVWLHLPDTIPLQAVVELSEFYGSNRGLIEYAPVEIDKIRSEKLEKIKFHSRNWAEARGKAECAVILTDITSKAGNQDASQMVLLKLIEDIGEYSPSPFGLGLINQELGDISLHLGKSNEALNYYKNAVKFYQEADHIDGANASLQGIALIQRNIGNFSQAEKTIRDYLEYAKSNRDCKSIIHALLDLGNLCRETGRYSEGLVSYQEVINLAVQHGQEILHGHALLGIGLIENILGKPEEAEKKVNEAIEIYYRLGYESFLSESLRELAQIFFKRGDVKRAFKLLEEAREKAILVGNKSRIIRTDWIYGELLSQLGKYSEAIQILKNTSIQAEELNDINLIISVLQSLGLALQNLGNAEESYQIYQNALEKAETLGLDVKAAGLYNNIGIIFEQKGDLNRALINYVAADKVFKRIGQLESIAGSQGNIANVNFRLGNYKEASKNYQEALKIFEELQDIGGILRSQYNIANVIYQTGNIEQAKASYRQAINLAEQYGQHGLKDIFQLNYAGILFGVEDYTEAIELYSNTYSSSLERKDYHQAGTASYYSGLAYMRQGNAEEASRVIEEAISVWKMLEEEPPQITEAQEVLNSLKQHLDKID